jgi:hypothetical protein
MPIGYRWSAVSVMLCVGPVKVVSYQESPGVRLPSAMLVRPDGYVAWASGERDPAARERAAAAAVRQWCAAE